MADSIGLNLCPLGPVGFLDNRSVCAKKRGWNDWRSLRDDICLNCMHPISPYRRAYHNIKPYK